MSDERPVEEQDNNSRTIYQELCNSYRAIDDFRAKLLGFLPLATGTGIFLLLDNAKLLDGAKFKGGQLLVAAGIFGLAITLGLFFYELYGIKKCHALINAGKELEERLRIDNGQFKKRPREAAGLINEPFAAGVIYPAVLAAWTFLAVFFMPQNVPSWAPQVAPRWAIGVFIIGFTISLLFNLWLKLELEEKIRTRLKLEKNPSITMSLVSRWGIEGVVVGPRQPDGKANPQGHGLYYYLVVIGLTIIALFIFFVAVEFLVPAVQWYFSPISDPNEDVSINNRKDLVQGVASVGQAVAVFLAGVAGAIGLIFTWLNLRETRENTERTLELTAQGQITDRFTKAIDQLGATDNGGSKKLETRLGAIYALERIDKESPERAYHRTVMEVLAAYVRENAPCCPKESATPTLASDELPDPDVQAILDVLGRRTKGVLGRRTKDYALSEEYRVALDLRRTDLRGAHLRKADLRGARFYVAKLQGARLQEADLRSADLQCANLEGANLEGANLEGATLIAANLERAIGLTSEQLIYTIGDKATKVSVSRDPNDPELWREIERPETWDQSPEEQERIIEEHHNRTSEDV